MIDGIKILNLSVAANDLLANQQLLFPLAVDERTGAVIDRPRQANDRGLTFTLVQARQSDTIRCELKGSLHRYHNQGRHNADTFSLPQLATTIDELVTRLAINPFTSRLNNLEFGVNVVLPFPVKQVLNNLVGYKYRPFTKEPGEGFDYYQCYTQRYVVKLYDKGAQYRKQVPGLAPNVLRIEVKVLKMEYLTQQNIRLTWLADLLNTELYGALGKLLVATFQDILFDEPSLNTARLSARQRDLYQNGRNPRYWLMPDSVAGKQYERQRKGLQRMERRFRQLAAQLRQGADWPDQVATLIDQQWQQLTSLSAQQQVTIDDYRMAWQRQFETAGNCPKLTEVTEPGLHRKCPKLTGVIGFTAVRGTAVQSVKKCPKLTGSENGKVSQINPLSIVLNWDTGGASETSLDSSRGTSNVGGILTQSEGEKSSHVSAPSPGLLWQPLQPLWVDPPVSFKSGEPLALSAQPEPDGSVLSEPVKTEVASPRLCLITGLDISHQRADTWLITAKTLKEFYTTNRTIYDQLAKRYLTQEQRKLDVRRQSATLALKVRQLARNVHRTPKKRSQHEKRLIRLCPITGLDITHQRADVHFAARMTLLRLAQMEPTAFTVLVTRFLPPQQQQQPDTVRSYLIARTIRQLAARSSPTSTVTAHGY
ncbi:hypothetical protein WBJ53_04715 [Spirosoma sp. SC4-14]|uniref:hypothetical protein n=1 Tax=Spirosoma sp. SC4-14 TaxID=3128900 RepID=UPI0030D5E047